MIYGTQTSMISQITFQTFICYTSEPYALHLQTICSNHFYWLTNALNCTKLNMLKSTCINILKDKNSDMFRILWDPSSGSIKHASLKLLVMFVCVVGVWQHEIWTCGVYAWCNESHQAHTPQVQISRCQTPTTHTNITSNFSDARLILPEDGSQRIWNMVGVFNCLLKYWYM